MGLLSSKLKQRGNVSPQPPAPVVPGPPSEQSPSLASELISSNAEKDRLIAELRVQVSQLQDEKASRAKEAATPAVEAGAAIPPVATLKGPTANQQNTIAERGTAPPRPVDADEESREGSPTGSGSPKNSKHSPSSPSSRSPNRGHSQPSTSPGGKLERSPTVSLARQLAPKDSALRMAKELRLSGQIVLKSPMSLAWLEEAREKCFEMLEAAEKGCVLNPEGFYDLTLHSSSTKDEEKLTTRRSVLQLWEPILLALGESQNALVDDNLPKDNFRMWSTGVLASGAGSLKNLWPKRPPPATAMEAALYVALLAGMRQAPLTMLTCVHILVPLVDWTASIGLSRLSLPAGSVLIVDDKKKPKGLPCKRNSSRPVVYFTYCRRSPKDVEANAPELLAQEPEMLFPQRVTEVMTKIKNDKACNDESSEQGSPDGLAKKKVKLQRLRPSTKKLIFDESIEAVSLNTTQSSAKSNAASADVSSRAELPRRGPGPVNAQLENGTEVEDEFRAAGPQPQMRVLQSSRMLPNVPLRKKVPRDSLEAHVLKHVGTAQESSGVAQNLNRTMAW